jgi:apolipoprotein N-acyltransferase
LTIAAMPRSVRSDFRRAGDAPAQAATPFATTPWGRLALCLASVVMLSLAYAPLKQFYFAWFALTPWLVVVSQARTKRAAFFWSWLTGILFFSINLWWIGYVTVPGAMALMLYMGMWFALVALVLRGAGIFERTDAPGARPVHRTILSLFAVAAVWVTAEWTWGNLFTGLPWLYIGHTQTPILAMCQIADFTSAYGVSFWVVLVNAWFAFLILHRLNPARLIGPGLLILILLAAILLYGVFRMQQKTTYPGPTVTVVQPNFPQDNSGSKGATYDEILDFHFSATRAALQSLAQKHQSSDLVVWSETMMPELNELYRQYMQGFVMPDKRNVGDFLDSVHDQLGQLAHTFNTNLLVGGQTMLPDRQVNGKPTWNRRNSAYLFDRMGRESENRYDKIHLVPFGEFIPFEKSCPPLFDFFNLFNPYKGQGYTVQPGEQLTVFTLAPSGYRFVNAICFEDVDSTLMAREFAGPNKTKRADFIVNLTNDGWFATPQMQQHLQLSVFRCIENRVPTARSVNTGISGFIDSVGRVHDSLPVHTTGTSTARLELDHRIAPYTHLGDLFAWLCVAATGATVLVGLRNGMKNRRSRGR